MQGTGGVSIFGLQLAVASGATVIATSSSDRKLEAAKKLGAKHLINYKTTPNWEEKVLRITNGRGVDHILEVGGPGTIIKSVKAARYGGNVAVIGFVAGVSGACRASAVRWLNSTWTSSNVGRGREQPSCTRSQQGDQHARHPYRLSHTVDVHLGHRGSRAHRL